VETIVHARAQGENFLKLRYRPDVDGLRAAAVAGVLLFHAGLPQLSGGFAGVDIFFVISGYLITSVLLCELAQTNHIDFVNFWARRIRRILPSALLVIAATVGAAFLLISDLKILYLSRDALYAALYIINWQQLAARHDYFDEEAGNGLVLHYWSLAVEEQFYLFLTLVFLLALTASGFISRKIGWTARQVVTILLAVLGGLSLILVLAVDDQPTAFFGTHARIWELCLGSAVALLERQGFVPKAQTRSAMAWIGIVAILISFLAYDAHEFAYPGIYTLLPTLGAAMFLLAGVNGTDSRLPLPLQIGGTLVPVAIGKLSYALYLWHWPVFLLYQDYFGSWSTPDLLLALAATVALSITSYFAVENPIRFSVSLGVRPVQSIVAAFAVTLVLVGVVSSLGREIGGKKITLPGGTTLDPERVMRDRAASYADNCELGFDQTEYGICIYGSRLSRRKLFLVGDSHAAQWLGAAEQVAERYGFALYLRTKSACTATEVPLFHERFRRRYHECEEWRAKVLKEIEQLKPELVLIAESSHRSTPMRPKTGQLLIGEGRVSALAEAERRTIQRIAAAGSRVAMIVDTPLLPRDPIDCLVQNSTQTELCRWLERDVLPLRRFPWSFNHDNPPRGVTVIDLSDHLCWGGFCYAANRDHVIMRDDNHVTASFSASLGDAFAQRLMGTLRVPMADNGP
jgi:peptidoglycan/LPS O-acetylase OafA/YrhL